MVIELETQTKQREYNMDFARVLLIFMVIVLHYNNRGMGGALNYAAAGGVKEFILRFSESFCICAVDAFLILSGYFSDVRKKSPYKKAIFLLLACSFYRTVAYVLHATLVIHEFSIRSLLGAIVPANWFVCLFVTTMLLAPFIDRLLYLTGDDMLNELMVLLTGLFVVVPTIVSVGGDIVSVDLTGLSTISVMGDLDGFNIIAFIFCYCVGFHLRKRKDFLDTLPGYVYFIFFLILAIFSTLLSFVTEKVWSYLNVLTILEAITFVLAFSRMKVTNEKIGKIASMLGGCGLGVFVWHTTPFMLYGFWVHFEIPSIADAGVGSYLGNMFCSTLAMFAVSMIWVLVCRTINSKLMKIRKKNNEA